MTPVLPAVTVVQPHCRAAEDKKKEKENQAVVASTLHVLLLTVFQALYDWKIQNLTSDFVPSGRSLSWLNSCAAQPAGLKEPPVM